MPKTRKHRTKRSRTSRSGSRKQKLWKMKGCSLERTECPKCGPNCRCGPNCNCLHKCPGNCYLNKQMKGGQGCGLYGCPIAPFPIKGGCAGMCPWPFLLIGLDGPGGPWLFFGCCFEYKMELVTGIEPVTSSLPRKCSTTELHEHLGVGVTNFELTRTNSPHSVVVWRPFVGASLWPSCFGSSILPPAKKRTKSAPFISPRVSLE